MRLSLRRAWRLPSALTVGAAIAASAIAASASAQSPGVASSSDTEPIALTVSGGISLGSYQSGVNWALLEFFKKATRDEAYRARYASLHPGKRALPRFVLSSVAGASAGNMNGVLSALEWCSSAPDTAPERSLFWSAWITTGWAQLFPATPSKRFHRGQLEAPFRARDSTGRDTSDLGVFSRVFYRQKHFRDLDGALAKRTHVAGCDVPVGITLTRLYPQPYQVGELSPMVQRSAAVLRVRVGPSGAASFVQAVQAVREDPSVGEVIAMAAPAPDADTVPPVNVYSLIEASSAFPVAFGPRRLYFYHASELRSDGRCPVGALGQCLPPHAATFVDGGVFDNNPIDLAVTLDARRRGAAMPHRAPRVLYIDPDALRDSAGAKMLKPVVLPVDGGVGAAIQLLRGAVPAARQYELFAFLRANSRKPRAEQPRIFISDRYHPLVGENLNAFAAFLGRPFREYDFYVGMYDAAAFIAKRWLCDAGADSDSLPQTAPPPALQACVRTHLREIIDGEHFALGPVAPSVMRALFETEYPDDGAAKRPPVRRVAQVSTDDSLRTRVLLTIASAMRVTHSPRAQQPCRHSHVVENLLCHHAFDVALDQIRTPEVRRIAQTWARSPACDTLALIDACYADQNFVELLRDPTLFTHRATKDLLRRVYLVERASTDLALPPPSARPALAHAPAAMPPPAAPMPDVPASVDTATQHGYERFAEVMEFWYRSGDERFRRGLDLDPSTIPGYEHGKLSPLTIAPFQMASTWYGRTRMFTWRPTLYIPGKPLGAHMSIIAPIELLRVHMHDPDRYAHHLWRSDVGVGVSVQIPSFWLNGLQLTGLATTRSGVFAAPRVSRTDFGAEASLLTLGGKVKFGARRLPESVWGKAWYERLPIVLGVSDLNGLLYWTLRQFH